MFCNRLLLIIDEWLHYSESHNKSKKRGFVLNRVGALHINIKQQHRFD